MKGHRSRGVRLPSPPCCSAQSPAFRLCSASSPATHLSPPGKHRRRVSRLQRVCTGSGRIRFPERSPAVGGCEELGQKSPQRAEPRLAYHGDPGRNFYTRSQRSGANARSAATDPEPGAGTGRCGAGGRRRLTSGCEDDRRYHQQSVSHRRHRPPRCVISRHSSNRETRWT